MSQLAHIRPRRSTEIIDGAFGLYRARFGDLLVVSVLILVPALLVVQLGPYLPDWLTFLIMLAGNLMYVAGQGAIAILVAATVERDEAITAGTVFRRLGRRGGTVILVAIATSLLVMLGFVFLIIPGFIAMAWTAAAIPATAIEGLSVGAAIRRSRELARGRIGHVLVTLILIWLIFAALGFGFMIAFTIAVATLGLTNSSIFLVLVQLIFVPIFPLFGVVTTMLYYDLRVRSDGADVAAMIDALPVTPAGPA